MVLRGKIMEIPDRLFFRRLHSEAASSVQDMNQLTKIYNPANRRYHNMYYWRLVMGAASAIRRAPLRQRERVSLYGYLARHMLHTRERLVRELGYRWGLLERKTGSSQ
jgi:hypothetical protein